MKSIMKIICHNIICMTCCASGLFSSIAIAETTSKAPFVLTEKSNAQDNASGFINGQSVSGVTKNWLSNELGRRGQVYPYKEHGAIHTTSRRISWTQGTVLKYNSGYTSGLIGLSGEAAIYNEIALERSRKDIANGSSRTLVDHNGDAVGQWSKLGLANIKARISNTTLTVGRQNVFTPVLDVMANRALPSSFQGYNIHSEEFENLSFDAGVFDRVSPRTEQSLTKFTSAYQDVKSTADRVYISGVNYQPTGKSSTSLYIDRVQDYWDQFFASATVSIGDLTTLELKPKLAFYKTKDSGKSKLGRIDNEIYNFSLKLKHESSTLGFSYQENLGNEYADYLKETKAFYLDNSMYSDFNGPNEKSFQVSYQLDFAPYGLPGLAFNAYNIRGWGIDGTHYRGSGYVLANQDNEHHEENGVGLSYAIQSGSFKGSAVRGTYMVHRGSKNQIDGNVNEFRLVTTIPFNAL